MKNTKKTPEYCTQNNGDCLTCSLVNYGRDCRNNPVDKRKGGSKQEPGAGHKQDTGRKPKGSSALDRLDAARENLDRQIEEYDAGR